MSPLYRRGECVKDFGRPPYPDNRTNRTIAADYPPVYSIRPGLPGFRLLRFQSLNTFRRIERPLGHCLELLSSAGASLRQPIPRGSGADCHQIMGLSRAVWREACRSEEHTSEL